MLTVAHSKEYFLVLLSSRNKFVVDVPMVHLHVDSRACIQRDRLFFGHQQIGHIFRGADDARSFSGKHAFARRIMRRERSVRMTGAIQEIDVLRRKIFEDFQLVRMTAEATRAIMNFSIERDIKLLVYIAIALKRLRP